MTETIHFDTGKILGHEYTSDGFLRVTGRVARTGNLIYRDGDKTRTEYVSPDVLFAKDSINSLKMIPLTLDHPSEIVTPDNSREHQRGMTGHSVIIDGDFLGITMTVTDSEAINAIVSGAKSELSCGYRATVARRGDSSEYEQLSRNYNHVAIVERGRAGPNVRVLMDSADVDTTPECWVADSIEPDPPQSVTPTESELCNQKPRRDMASRQFTINNEIITVEEGLAADAISTLLTKLDETKLDSADDTAKLSTLGYSSHWDAINGLKAKLDSAETSLTETKTKLDAAEGKVTGLELQLQERGDAAATETKTDAVDVDQIRADAEAKIGTEVKARMDAWAEVAPRLPKDFTIDHSLDVTDIYRAYLSAAHPSLSLDGKDAAYIQGVYQGLTVGSESTNKADSVRTAIHESRADMSHSKKMEMDGKETTMNTTAKRSRPLPGMKKEAS